MHMPSTNSLLVAAISLRPTTGDCSRNKTWLQSSINLAFARLCLPFQDFRFARRESAAFVCFCLLSCSFAVILCFGFLSTSLDNCQLTSLLISSSLLATTYLFSYTRNAQNEPERGTAHASRPMMPTTTHAHRTHLSLLLNHSINSTRLFYRRRGRVGNGIVRIAGSPLTITIHYQLIALFALFLGPA